MFSKLSITTIIILMGATSFAQQTPLFQQVSRVPKTLSNLSEPDRTADSFLGQDKKGPYVLSWRNFILAPGYPVWVTVDDLPLRTSDYSVNLEKGEISFNQLIKRTQVVKVNYSYYPESATKNSNPALTAPLTFKLAALGVKNLQLTTFPSSSMNTAPATVLNYATRTGGLNSELYLAPNVTGQTNLTNQSAVKLGYTTGNNTNGLNAAYQRGGKGFSPYSKSFGTTDSSEVSSLNGKFSPNKDSSLSFNFNDNKSLNSSVENTTQNAAFKFGGGNKPLLNYSVNDQQGTDVKGVFSSSRSENGNLNSKFGALDLAYKTTSSDVISNKARTVTSQNVLSANLPQLKFNRITDSRQDPKAGQTDTITDTVNYNTKLSGGTLGFVSNQTNTQIGSRSIQTDQRVYNLGFKGNKHGFGGVDFGRVENDMTTNNTVINSVNDKGSFSASLNKTQFSFNFNKVDANINGAERKDVSEQNLLFSLPSSKSVPVAKFTINESIKRNDKGVLVGSSNELTEVKSLVGGANLTIRTGTTETYTPDGKNNTVVSDSGNVSLKLGPGMFNLESVSSDLVGSDKTTGKIDQQRFSFAAPAKKRSPGFEFQRTNTDSTQNKIDTNSLIDKFKIQSVVGSANVVASANQSSTQSANANHDVKDNAVSVSTPIWGRGTSVGVSVNNYNSENGSIVETKTGLGVNLVPSKNITLATEQQENTINDKSFSSVKHSFSYNLPTATLQTAVSTASNGAQRIDVRDYRAAFGTNKTLFKVDSSVKMRESTDNNPLLNSDTTNTVVQVNAVKGLALQGNYILNPDDPTKPGTLSTVEKRGYGFATRFNNLEVSGTYSSVEYLKGTPADVIVKAGGSPLYNETGLKLGWRFGTSNLISEYKNQFFSGAASRELEIYSLGFTHNSGDRFSFSLTGTYSNNRSAANSANYTAAAKFGFKF